MHDWVEGHRALVLALCGAGLVACIYFAWLDDAVRATLVRFFELSPRGPAGGGPSVTLSPQTALMVHPGPTGQSLVASRAGIAVTPFPTLGDQPDAARAYQHELTFRQRQLERRDAYEEQALQQQMELAAVAHLDTLAAARLAIVTRARERRDEAVLRALARRYACIDARRTRAEACEDHTRRRHYAIEDEVRARVESLDAHVLRRPEVLARLRFEHEVGEQQRTLRRQTWQTDAEDRARARSDAAEERLRIGDERERTAKATERKERKAARDAARARRQAEAAAEDKQRDTAQRRREKRARLRAAEKAAVRQARVERVAAKQEAEWRAAVDAAAVQADAYARVRQAAFEASDEELAEDHRVARQRRREVAALTHEIAMAEQRGQLHAVEAGPPPPDPAQAALEQDCARIALDVSTGTVLLDDQNCYHGFAAIKFHEFLGTMSPADAQAATAQVLYARRWQQPPLTLDQARAFAAQFERTREAAREDAALETAQDVLAQFNVGTEDRYGR